MSSYLNMVLKEIVDTKIIWFHCMKKNSLKEDKRKGKV